MQQTAGDAFLSQRSLTDKMLHLLLNQKKSPMQKPLDAAQFVKQNTSLKPRKKKLDADGFEGMQRSHARQPRGGKISKGSAFKPVVVLTALEEKILAQRLVRN